jgi:hypothetical protein
MLSPESRKEPVKWWRTVERKWLLREFILLYLLARLSTKAAALS